MKKKALLAAAVSALFLAGCGGGGSSSASSNPSSPESSAPVSSEPVVTYTVSLVNGKNDASIGTSTVNAGSSFSKPSDPSYADHLFGGWYLDKAYTQEASFPLTVNSNVTLYARFNTYLEHFLIGRDKTFIDSIGYKYSSSTNLSVSYTAPVVGPLTLAGVQSGTSSYSQGASVSFLETHSNSGALFNDGFKTTYKKNETLFTISEDENHKVTGYKTETKDSSFRYDSSSFAKALFEYEEKDIKSVTPTSTSGRYELKTATGATSVAKLVLGNVNNAIVEKIIGSLPETDSSYHMYVSFDSNGYVSSYDYEFGATVSGVTVSLTYGLDVSSAGSAVTITEPSFPGLYLSDTEVKGQLDALNSAIGAYKSSTYSGYDYRIDSTMDIADVKSVGVTTKGSTKRKVEGGVVYYNNSVEVDSELKDSDMYGSDENVKDYERTRGKLSDGTVYDVTDPLIGFKSYDEVASPLASDEFYGFIPSEIMSTTYVDAIQKTEEGNLSEYSLVVGSAFTTKIFDYVNEITRIDPTLAKSYKALGSYTANTLELSEAIFSIGLTGGAFTAFAIEIHGVVTTSYEGTNIQGSADFDLTIEVTANDNGNNYEIPAAKEDII